MVAAKLPDRSCFYGLSHPVHLRYRLADRLYGRHHHDCVSQPEDGLAGLVRSVDAAGADRGDAAGDDGAWVAAHDGAAAGAAERGLLLCDVQGLSLADAARTGANLARFHPAVRRPDH